MRRGKPAAEEAAAERDCGPAGTLYQTPMVSSELLLDLINVFNGTVIAGLITHHWRFSGRDRIIGHWMLAAWLMIAADAVFALKSGLPGVIVAVLPTMLVTSGECVLLAGARRTRGLDPRLRQVGAFAAVHLVAIAGLGLAGVDARWRMVADGAMECCLSALSFAALRHPGAGGPNRFRLPAAVFAIHAILHTARLTTNTYLAVKGQASTPEWIHIYDELEDSFFVIILFVSLLTAHLRQRNDELQQAIAEVKELSGLLPICAWCRQVRDDTGYWRKIEEYFQTKGRIRFTHCICEACAEREFPREAKRVK